MLFYMVYMYAKNEQGDLSPTQIRALARVVLLAASHLRVDALSLVHPLLSVTVGTRVRRTRVRLGPEITGVYPNVLGHG